MQKSTVKNYKIFSLIKIKQHLRSSEDDTDDNALIQDYLESAVDECERFTKRDIASTVTTIEENALLTPFGPYIFYDIKQPFISGVTIIIDGVLLDSSKYHIAKNNTCTCLYFPTAITGMNLKITYTSGYQRYSDVPKGILQAIRIKTAEYYDGDANGYVVSNNTATKQFERLLIPYSI